MLVLPTFSANLYNNTRTQNRQTSFRYSNLAPLKQDTVSFTSGKKKMGDGDLKFGIDKKTAIQISNDAKQSYIYLDQKLQEILGDMIKPENGKGSLSKPIEKITSRIKEPHSILEKSATRRLLTMEEVKDEMTDIIGARIVMADTSREAVDSVIERFTKAVKKDKIKIIEIENYRPEPEYNEKGEVIKSYDYASPSVMKDLKIACDSKKGTSIRKADEDTPSGYMAIHMLVMLPNGFTGEIQILGSEVERLKDVEDMCFKVKNGKHLKPKYSAVENMLKPLTNKHDSITRKEHSIYTRKAYQKQRDIELYNPHQIIEPKPEFLHIPEYMPSDLDFNNVAEKIQECKQ